jgi:hypothetical protein
MIEQQSKKSKKKAIRGKKQVREGKKGKES